MVTKRKTSEKVPGPGAAPGRRKRTVATEKVLVRLESHQARALRDEAARRARERGKLQADASEVLREIINEWLHRRGTR